MCVAAAWRGLARRAQRGGSTAGAADRTKRSWPGAATRSDWIPPLSRGSGTHLEEEGEDTFTNTFSSTLKGLR